MEIKLWKNFIKKINSTKQPENADAIIKQVVLKQDTSIENPIFIIDGIDLEVNYCYFSGHYYFIEDIVVTSNRLYELHCVQDVLATHKSTIQNYTAFVEYSDTLHNPHIPDKRLSMTNEIVTASSSTLEFINTAGTVILTVAGKDTTAQVGFTSAYALSDTSVANLADWLYTTEIAEQFAKLFGDPYKAIIEAHWVPWNISTEGTTIHIGKTDSAITARGLNVYSRGGYREEIEMNIPWIYNDWRDFAPYANLQIYLPFYGVVDLDQEKFIDQTKIKVIVYTDPISGEVLYNIQCGEWNGTYKCDASVPLSIGQTTGQKLTGISEFAAGVGTLLGGAITSVASGGLSATAVAGILAGGITGIGAGALTYFQKESSGHGGTGGFGSSYLVISSAANSDLRKIKLTLYAHKFATNEDMSTFIGIEGKPYFQKISLSLLSGYVKCAAASVPIAGLASDRDQVNQWLNQGIFIE